MLKNLILKWPLLKILVLSILLGFSAHSYAIDLTGWTCEGACGSLGADGVVTLPPTGEPYGWIASTSTSPTGLAPTSITASFSLDDSDTGSRITSPLFSVTSGAQLSFDYNYVSTDGAEYADYAWARLLDENGNEVAIIFTSRTTDTGNTVPGLNMPAPAATLSPATAPIIPGAPTWAPLGASSFTCFNPAGCGYTGWVHGAYTIASAGTYRLELGVVNWTDSAFQSGLAFDGFTITGATDNGATAAIPTLNEWALLLMGLLLGGLAWYPLQRKR